MFLKTITWRDALPKIRKVFPEFADAIELLNPPEHYKLYAVKYPYGQNIVDRGTLYLPNAKKQYVPVQHPSIDQEIQDNLAYSLGMPMGIITKNKVELCLDSGTTRAPLSLMHPGRITSLWTVLQPNNSPDRGQLWTLTSGACSTFMLPNIGNMMFHKNIDAKFKKNIPLPKSLHDHYETFVEVTHNTKWYSEIILFSGEWLENNTESEWKLFRYFLYETIWETSTHLRNLGMYNFIFSYLQSQVDRKIDPYIVDTFKHLIAIAAGHRVGFAPAINEDAIPLTELTDIYTSLYNIKQMPIVMTPTFLDKTRNSAVCYSMMYPSLIDFSPKNKRQSTVAHSLEELQFTINHLFQELDKDEFNLSKAPASIYSLTRNTNLEIFHNSPSSSWPIITEAPLMQSKEFRRAFKLYNGLEFPTHSPFFAGCIIVSNRK